MRDPLESGIGFSVLGDSISTLRGWNPKGWRVHYEGEARIAGVEQPDDTWWGRVISELGGRMVANSSFSGSTVEGFGFPAGESDERIEALAPGTEKPASCARSASTEPGSVETGSAEPGSAKTRSASSAGESLPATSTVGCYKYSIRGVPLDDYNRAIREAAAQNGAHVADVRAFGVCYDAVDGVHPSASGMRQLAAMVLAQMRGLPADPSLVPELAAAQRARRTCSRLGCAGCGFADADPSSWTLCCAGPDR